jgi:CheY-like chemotaxis protein
MINNSIEAMPGGGQLTISTGNIYIEKHIVHSGKIPEGQYIKIAISDTGVGINPADLERIFEPFYSTKKTGRTGTGLGMAVVWSSVLDHRGYIDIKTSTGKGTEMILYFPVDPGVAMQHSLNPTDTQVESKPITGRGESILLVDDLPEQLEIGTKILEKLEYRAASASSGEEAVAYLQTHQADLVILDMVMEPGLDGLETYEQIISITPAQKVIIASGYAETQGVKNALQLGVDQFVRKPYSLRTLGEAIRNALAL